MKNLDSYINLFLLKSKELLQGCVLTTALNEEMPIVLSEIEKELHVARQSGMLPYFEILDWKTFVSTIIQVSLDLRRQGKFPFFLSLVIAAAFTQSYIEDDHLRFLAEFSNSVGIKHALKCYTKLDKEVDLIQLIFEQSEVIGTGHLVNRKLSQLSMIRKAYEAGYQAEVKYHGCSQCVLIGLSEVFNQVDPIVFKAATSLSGGMAQCGDGACGGYSGGILYMGTFIGRSWDLKDNDKENQYRSFAMCQKLHDKYVQTYGDVTGKSVHAKVFGEFYLLRDPKAKAVFKEMGAHEFVCPCVVGSAARWVAEILIDEHVFEV